jgi:hypothetical protein
MSPTDMMPTIRFSITWLDLEFSARPGEERQDYK